MALIKCEECGREISNKAAECPHCGCPVNEFEQEFSTGKETETGNATMYYAAPKKIKSRPSGFHMFLKRIYGMFGFVNLGRKIKKLAKLFSVIYMIIAGIAFILCIVNCIATFLSSGIIFEVLLPAILIVLLLPIVLVILHIPLWFAYAIGDMYDALYDTTRVDVDDPER